MKPFFIDMLRVYAAGVSSFLFYFYEWLNESLTFLLLVLTVIYTAFKAAKAYKDLKK